MDYSNFLGGCWQWALPPFRPWRTLIMIIEVVMILRVYAMYSCSRIILGALILMYITEIVILIIGCGIYSNSDYVTGTYRPKLTTHLRNSALQCQLYNCSTPRFAIPCSEQTPCSTQILCSEHRRGMLHSRSYSSFSAPACASWWWPSSWGIRSRCVKRRGNGIWIDTWVSLSETVFYTSFCTSPSPALSTSVVNSLDTASRSAPSFTVSSICYIF